MINTPVFLANNPAENGIYQKRVIAVNFNSENISFFNRQVRYLSLNGIMVFSYDSTESTLGFMKPAKTLPCQRTSASFLFTSRPNSRNKRKLLDFIRYGFLRHLSEAKPPCFRKTQRAVDVGRQPHPFSNAFHFYVRRSAMSRLTPSHDALKAFLQRANGPARSNRYFLPPPSRPSR
jgi:hypothetical protein